MAEDRKDSEDTTDAMDFMRLLWPAPLVVQCIRVATELGIAEHLAESPRSADDLASSCGVQPKTLSRLLTALSSVEVFSQDDEGHWQNTPLSEFLREDHPASMRSWALLMGHHMFWLPMGELPDSIATGRESFSKVFPGGIFEYTRANPEAGTLFNKAMAAQATGFMSEMPKIYDFSRFNTLADIGGGTGTMLAMTLREYPSLKGILFELPDVIDEVDDNLVKEFDGRLKLESGNFFDSVPDGIDCYMAVRVIHDWPDDKALKILKNIRDVMKPDGTLLLLDGILDENAPPNFAMMDMLMLVLAGSMERTEDDFRKLLAESGFDFSIIRHKNITMMECRPV